MTQTTPTTPSSVAVNELTLPAALAILAEYAESRSTAKQLRQIAVRSEDGVDLEAAAVSLPQRLRQLLLRGRDAGCAQALLGDTLTLARQRHVRVQRLWSRLAYPLTMLVLSVAAAMVMTVYASQVTFGLETIEEDFGIQPSPAMSVSNVIRVTAVVVSFGGVFVLIAYAAWVLWNMLIGQRGWGALSLTASTLDRLEARSEVARFLATFVRANRPWPEAIETIQLAGDCRVSRSWAKATQTVVARGYSDFELPGPIRIAGLQYDSQVATWTAESLATEAELAATLADQEADRGGAVTAWLATMIAGLMLLACVTSLATQVLKLPIVLKLLNELT